jgi:uncharacterized membrane protein YoaK (UPF0700 family)
MPYSHPQALTREQALGRISHLLPGALAFAGTAGFINSVALSVFNSPVSHMTGALSYLGIESAAGHAAIALGTCTIILAFMAGAAAAGLVIGAYNLAPGRRYGAAICGEGALLFLAMLLLLHGQHTGVLLIALACGLQNAATSSYCGLMIRTTHVTGTVTDLGVMLGHWLRHRHIEHRKLALMLGLVLAFGSGVVLGALANGRWGAGCLVVPAAGCLLAGAAVAAFPGWFTRSMPRAAT